MTQCFRCGDDDHLSYDCPNRTPPHAAPPAPWPAAGADQGGRPAPPPFASLPQRRPEEIADPHPWAEQIRAQMGWSRDQAEEYRRKLAEHQAAVARWERLAFLDGK